MKVDFKALGKAMMMTGAMMVVVLGVALIIKWLGSGALIALNVVFLTALFYFILKD
jgi:hypothetical protein